MITNYEFRVEGSQWHRILTLFNIQNLKLKMSMDLIPDEPLQAKLMRNGFRLYFFQIFIVPAGYILKMIISRELTVEDVGLFYSILGLIGIISAYNDLGLTEALQYYLPRYFIDKEYAKAKTIMIFTRLVQFASALVVWWWLWLWSERLATHYFQSESAFLVLRYFTLYFLGINLLQVIQSLFTALQLVKHQQIIEIVRLRTTVILVIVAWQYGTLDLLSYTWRWLLGLAMGLSIALVMVWKKFARLFRDYEFVWEKSLLRQQWVYGFWIMLGVSGWTLFGQVNQQFALYFFWAQAAGYWTNYLSFYTMVGIVTWPLIWYLFPLLNELYKKWDNAKVKLLYRYLFAGIVVFGVVWGIGAYFLSEWLAVLLFGEAFAESGRLFAHYAPFLFTLPLIGVLFQDIASRGMVKQRVQSIVYALIVNLIASLILWKYFGLTGLVYGQLMGNLVLVGCGWYWWRKKL